MAQAQLIRHALGGASHKNLSHPPSSTSGHVLSMSKVIPDSALQRSLLGLTVNYDAGVEGSLVTSAGRPSSKKRTRTTADASKSTKPAMPTTGLGCMQDPDQAKPATSNYRHVRLPPPTDQPIDAKFNRNILDAAQRSLDEPPIDEGGLPLWDEAFFKYNGPQRKREPKQQDSKLHFDYAPRQAPSIPSAASSSSSLPQTPAPVPTLAQVMPMCALSLVALAKEAMKWFASSNSGRIVQNDDPVPETAGLNVGGPPAQYPQIPNQNPQQARVQTQNQASPRPQDVLSQPTSLVNDPEDDPLLLNVGSSGLSHAPAHCPMSYVCPGPPPTLAAALSELHRASRYRLMTTGQVPNGDELEQDRAPACHTTRPARPGHPHVCAATNRAPVRSDTMMNNESAELPAWTAYAPISEGPAYEEAVGGQTAWRRSAPGGSGSGAGVSGTAGTREWHGIQARPQVQERVAGARHSTGAPVGAGGAPYGSSSSVSYGSSAAAQAQTRSTMPKLPAPATPTPMATITYTPIGTTLGPRGFEVGATYYASQQYALGRSDTVSAMIEAQMALRTEGANPFYPVVVALTIKTTVAFQNPPLLPWIRSPVGDDRSSVFSGRSDGSQRSAYSGSAGAKMSVHGPGMGAIGSPEDAKNPGEHGTQTRSGQWVGSGGSGNRSGVGVWSHGSFNTGDPSVPLLWEETRLKRLRQLDYEARLLGYTLVPLSWSFPQPGSQPSYQYDMPPLPPVPLPFQPEPSSSAAPEWDNEFNQADMRSSLQRDIPAPRDSLLHSIDTYSILPPGSAPDIPPDPYLDLLPPDALRDLGTLPGDRNTSQPSGVSENDIDQLGWLSDGTLGGLGIFSDTPNILSSSFTAQAGSTNSNVYAPGLLNYYNTSSFHDILAPFLTARKNPVTAALLQHDPTYIQHTTTRFSQSDQAYADQIQLGSDAGHIAHPHNQGPPADTPSGSTANPVLQQSQAHTAGFSTSYQFFNETPDTYRRAARRAGN